MKKITLIKTLVCLIISLTSNQSLPAQVSGTRTIPGTYASIGAALADIQSSGLSGHVILELQQNYNWQNEVYPIVVPENFPTSANATVTIRPRIGAIDIHIGTDFSGGVVPATGDIPIFDIYGSYFNIDGRPAGGGTISQLYIWSNASEGTAVQLSNNANNNTISYCHLKGVNHYASGIINGPVYRKGVVTFYPAGPFPVGVLGGIHDNTIHHNIIEGDIRPGGISTYVASPLYGIYANGNSNAPNINNKILDNQILNFTYSGIEIKPDGPGAGWIIKGNSFYSTLPDYYPEYAIDIFHTGYPSGTNIIEGNFIGGNAPFAAGKWQGGPFFGIVCGTYDGGDSVSVRNNIIKNMEKINPDPYPSLSYNRDVFAGISITNSYGSNKVYCAANFIGGDNTGYGISVSAPAAGGNANFYGILYNNCSGGAITQNTIQKISMASAESSSFIGIKAFVINNVTIADNIIQQADVQSSGSVSVNNIFITDDHHEVPPCETGTQPVTLENNTMRTITATAAGSADLTGVKINSRLSSNTGNVIGSATEANSILVTGNTATINGVVVNGEPANVSISNDIIANVTANGVNGSVVNGVHFNGTGTVKISGNDIKNLNAATLRGIFIEPLGGTSSVTVEGNTIKGVSTSYGTGVEVNIPSASTTNFVATNNTINTWQAGFLVTSASGSTLTQKVQGNFVTGNQTGYYNQGTSLQDATCNWWGSASGPGGAGPGTGDPVGTNVLYSPWAVIPTFVAVNAGADQTIYLGYGPTSKIISPVYTVCGSPTYLWSNGATTPSITVSPTVTTTYSVTLTDANGHTASDTVLITVKDIRCGNNKVKVCHKDIKNRKQTLCIPTTEVPAHLAHGDALGDCVAGAAREGLETAPGISSADMLNIYPNPAAGTLQVYWNAAADGLISLKVIDIFGRTLIQKQLKEIKGNNLQQLSLEKLRAGNYILVMNSKDNCRRSIFSVQK
jgi:hypothetical protein